MAEGLPTHPPQRFNHVAMTVPAELLDEEGRAELLHFYGEVFGWTEMPTLTEDRKRLVLRAHSNEQFVFLVAGDRPMRTSASDHFGLSVDTPEQLDAMLERARRLARDDVRVVIVDKTVEEFRSRLLWMQHKRMSWKGRNFIIIFVLPATVYSYVPAAEFLIFD